MIISYLTKCIDFILVFVDASNIGNVAAFSFNDDSVARSYDIRVSFCKYVFFIHQTLKNSNQNNRDFFLTLFL